jgi:hypothetical protein
MAPSANGARPPRSFLGVTTPSRTVLGLLFPSWTFFDAARLTPTLQVRRLATDGPADVWRAAVTPPRRRWWHVVFNPAGTQTLAAQTLVEAWYRELTEDSGEAPADGASLPLVMALAEWAVLDLVGPVVRDGDDWQLRLVVTHAEGGEFEVIYESGRMARPMARRTS